METSEWVSAGERVPKKGTWVYVYMEYTYKALCNHNIACYQKNGTWTIGQNVVNNITHWMPLPKSPKILL